MHTLNGNINANQQMAQLLSGLQTLLQSNKHGKSCGEGKKSQASNRQVRRPRRRKKGGVAPTKNGAWPDRNQTAWNDWGQNGWSNSEAKSAPKTLQGKKLTPMTIHRSSSSETMRSAKSGKSGKSEATTANGHPANSSIWG